MPRGTYAGSARLVSLKEEVKAVDAVLRSAEARRGQALDWEQVAALARVLRRRRSPGPQAKPQRYVQSSQSQLMGFTDNEMRRLLRRCLACLVGRAEEHDRLAEEIRRLLLAATKLQQRDKEKQQRDKEKTSERES